jgi:hypothetical protein
MERTAELLSNRDKIAECLVIEICRAVMGETRELARTQALEQLQNGTNSSSLSADELEQFQMRRALERLSECSPVLAQRYGPLLRNHFQHLQEERLQDAFAEIQVEGLPTAEKARVYKRCFENFVDDEEAVAFATFNKSMLGGLTAKDYWILVFFIIATCRRIKGDSILQLIISGTKCNAIL